MAKAARKATINPMSFLDPNATSNANFYRIELLPNPKTADRACFKAGLIVRADERRFERAALM